MDVWAFKNKVLGDPDGKPLFNNQHVLTIYDSQKEGGRKIKRKRKSKSFTKKNHKNKKYKKKTYQHKKRKNKTNKLK
jgi:hypothetical protein